MRRLAACWVTLSGGMRCPSCGTENAPDSRFCGVCGMQQPQPAPSAARLAPTAKIPDDAPLAPPSRSVAPVPASGPVSYAPPSMPPPGQAGLTTRPGGHVAPARPSTDMPRPSGDYAQVRASNQYGNVQRQPSGGFDSVTPTAQHRQPAPIPGTNSGRGGVSARAATPPAGVPTDAPQGSSPRPRASEPSMSFSSAPRRSTGLIALVLLVDLALAATGGILLAKGLSSPAAATAKPPVKP